MVETENKKLAPPYMSWRTFSNFIETLIEAIPTQINSSVMIKLSGQNQRMVLNTLRFFDLVDSDDSPNEYLQELVSKKSSESHSEYRLILKRLLEKGYPSLFDGSDKFSLERSSPKEFDSKFRQMGVQGNTVNKCQAFFIFAAQEAEIVISKFILDARKKGRKPGYTKPTDQSKNHSEKNSTAIDEIEQDNSTITHNKLKFSEYSETSFRWLKILDKILDKLPEPDSGSWTSAERERWLNVLKPMLDLYIELDD